MLIHVWIEGSQPLAGTAAIEGSEPLHFDGWLELLWVVSELVAVGPPGGDPNTAKRDMRLLHPESPASWPNNRGQDARCESD
jgi:hypothetical protein